MKSAAQKYYLSGVLLVFSGTLFFSAKSIFIKKIYQWGVDPQSLMVLRMAMAIPFYALVFALNTRRESALSLKDFLAVAGIGVIGYYVASYLDLTGLVYITASFERMILYLFPCFVLVLSVVFLKHKLTLAEVIAFGLSYLGITLIYIQDLHTGGQNVTLGMLLVVGSALAFSVFVVLSGKYIAKVGAVRFTSVSMLGASIAVLLHFLLDNPGGITQYDGHVYGLVFVLALFCTVLPSYLVNMGVKRIGAPRAAIIGTVSPVFTIAMAYVFLHEVSTLVHVAGFMLVIMGIAVITLAKHMEPVKQPVEMEKATG